MAFLGDPLRPAGPLTFGQAVADDREERFPGASLAALHKWGYPAYQVPAQLGGRLESVGDLFALGRAVAARDPAVAILANSPFAAAMPVWLAGTPAQRGEVAQAILSGQRVALRLGEDAGVDRTANETTARRSEAGYVLDGSQGLVSGVRLARFLCLLVRESERQGLRSPSLLLVDLARLPPRSFELLPRISTHGVRGADIGGIRFHDAPVPGDACIGRPGRGLELAAQSRVVNRTLVPALSLGALDTALCCTVDFLRRRRLYGGLATDIPYVQDELAAAFLDLLVAEVVACSCVRVLHRLPELSPLSSAVAKYLVPHLVESRMRALATVLGARHFLRQDHWFGIFEKLLRDVRLFSLVHGSAPDALAALAAQVSCLSATDTEPARADSLFDPGVEAGTNGHPFASREFPTAADEDPVTAGLDAVCGPLEQSAADEALRDAARLLRAEGRDVRAQADQAVDPRSQAGQCLGERYARLFAAVCLARNELARRAAARSRLPAPWLAAGLIAVLKPGTRMPRPTSRALFQELLRRCTDGLEVAMTSVPDKEMTHVGNG